MKRIYDDISMYTTHSRVPGGQLESWKECSRQFEEELAGGQERSEENSTLYSMRHARRCDTGSVTVLLVELFLP
jgi:hypothetical protein